MIKKIGGDYEEKLTGKLCQGATALDKVNDYLWENSSNKEGDEIQLLATWNFDTFSLRAVSGAGFGGRWAGIRNGDCHLILEKYWWMGYTKVRWTIEKGI